MAHVSDNKGIKAVPSTSPRGMPKNRLHARIYEKSL